MAEAPPLRRADPAGPVVFIVFAVAGALFIIGAKALHMNAYYVTGVPVLLMLGYALSIWLFRGLRLRSDQSGDNFYYMGFIFTLTSLAVTLIQFSDGANASEIVRNFGVAVATTIAGIVLRIVFNLFRRDPMEVEHDARLQLGDAARKVRQQLNEMLLEFSHFGRTQQQMTAETFAEFQDRAQQASDTMLEFLSSEEHAKTITRVHEELQRTAELMAEINAALGEVPDAIYSRRRGFWSRLAFWSRPAKRSDRR